MRHSGKGPHMDEEEFDPEQPVELPLDGNLDLHLFHPKDVPALEGGWGATWVQLKALPQDSQK
jgi:hypothetical protein